MPKKPNDPCAGCGDPPEPGEAEAAFASAAHEGLVEGMSESHFGEWDPETGEIRQKSRQSGETAGKQLVDGERWSDYGDPRLAWDRVARLWTVVLGQHVTARQAVLCMIGLKIVRETINSKADNLEDIEGYTEILRRLER